ncbi:glycosyltransferase family 4 protein [Bacteroidales bacterium]|nr:glycosyltransferase family 4 protein [Bacteroidales bacterium]
MNIIQIIPGSGGSFYCGNCLRDSKFFDALRKTGHDVLKVPMYLPLFANDRDAGSIPVFYGAISIYMKQLYPIFRKAPAWVDSLLNSKPLMKMAANMAGSTRAKGLEEMTISMLLGEDGGQSKELDKMVDWIAEHCKPDIIHLSNALLLGLVHRLKEKLNVPIICSLQDEDVWVDVMKPSSRDKVWELMAEKAHDVDRFVSVSNYYAQVSRDRMNIPMEKISMVYLGVSPENYNYIPSENRSRNIGYISRLCHENGLDILVDAFIMMLQNPGFDDVNLLLTGGSTGDDKKYLKGIKKKIRKSGLENRIRFIENFEEEARHRFFDEISILSVPVRNGEAFGIYLTEAMASGIPIVQPNLGAFPEIVQHSDGGIVYEQNTPELLAETLANLLNDKQKLSTLSKNARLSIENKFNIQKLAGELIEVYEEVRA